VPERVGHEEVLFVVESDGDRAAGDVDGAQVSIGKAPLPEKPVGDGENWFGLTEVSTAMPGDSLTLGGQSCWRRSWTDWPVSVPGLSMAATADDLSWVYASRVL